jgi:hypothetical protein
MKNETELIKSTNKRQLTAKGYSFLNNCIGIMAQQYGLTRYHSEMKPKKEKLSALIHSLIIDEKKTTEEIKEMIKNRTIKNTLK